MDGEGQREPDGPESLEAEIAALESELADLDTRRAGLLTDLDGLRRERDGRQSAQSPAVFPGATVTRDSPPDEKLALFRRLLRGREDVYPRRWESPKTGRSGYQPACENEWVRGVCRKGKTRCAECTERSFLPVTDEVVRNHLRGHDPNERASSGGTREFTVGVYPLLQDETCWFLAADFDKSSWQDDALAFVETCRAHGVPAALERSRSGKGGHVWIFFAEPVPAASARRLGSFLLTQTMERRPEVGLDSYDRFFPNQDTMPQGGFGNLIALPLQRKPREQGNSLFVDDRFVPYEDQLAFLSSLCPMSREAVTAIVEDAHRRGQIIGVRMAVTDGDDDAPWTAPPSRRLRDVPVAGPLPERVNMVLGNELYVEKEGLPPSLINRLIRLAAFQNPEFYKTQAMRLSTFGKPRVISCAEDFPRHLGLPRGCLDEVLALLGALGIETDVSDERLHGRPLRASFRGRLRQDQEDAFRSLIAHDCGVLAATTAFGKTVVAARMVAERGVNTLILVHRQQLVDQWIERLLQFLDLERDQIGQIGAGKRKPTGIVDVALIQSLCRKGVVKDLVGEYGHIVIDECHHIPAQSFEQVARRCKARYVTGLSATVVRKDGHHPIIFMHCGPVRYQVDARKQAALRGFEHRVIVRPTAFRLDEADPDAEPTIHELMRALVEDGERNELIVHDVLEALAQGRSPVVLTERTAHLDLLAERLRPRVQHLIVLRGGMRAKQRRASAEALGNAAADEERLLLATGRYLGEGFDDARLDTLFLAMPISWRGTLAQYAGRLHREHDQKSEVVIYDCADLAVPMLARMYGRRPKGYRAIGYQVEEGSQ